jgi:UDPglucose 6-dehydrogenase
MRLSVIGLGKLGAPLAAVLASKGHDVVGADLNPAFVAAVNAGRAPVVETRLQEFIDASKGRLTATVDVAEAVAATDATYVIVPTPSQADGSFSVEHMLAAVDAIGRGLAKKSGYHLVTITSTVMPGDTEAKIKPALEQASGRRCGKDFGLCYNPEFIALGNVIKDMLAPDFILIGQSDDKAGALLQSIYESVCENKPPFARMNFVNAELAKISVNSFVTMRISFANQLARLCDHLPGADVDVVTSAIGMDTRIGKKYLKGAVSFGGPCFPRDNRAFARLAAGVGTEAPMAIAADVMNKDYLEHLVGRVTSLAPKGGTVALLGMSYKPDTGVTEESPSIVLASKLLERGVLVRAYDPLALPEAKAKLGQKVAWDASMADCLAQADLVILAVSWNEFKGLRSDMLKNGGRGVTIIDCWRQLTSENAGAFCRLIVPGRGSE